MRFERTAEIGRGRQMIDRAGDFAAQVIVNLREANTAEDLKIPVVKFAVLGTFQIDHIELQVAVQAEGQTVVRRQVAVQVDGVSFGQWLDVEVSGARVIVPPPSTADAKTGGAFVAHPNSR